MFKNFIKLSKYNKNISNFLSNNQKIRFFSSNINEQQPQKQENQEKQPNEIIDLKLEEYSPLQNAYIYNDEPIIEKFIKYNKVADQKDGSTILYSLKNEQKYLKGFTDNYSLGIIEDDLIEFKQEKNIPDYVLKVFQHQDQVDFDETFPTWESFEELEVPIEKLEECVQTVSDFSNFEHYGKKFSIVEYEIIAFSEVEGGLTYNYYEWIPITILQTQMGDKTINLAQYEGVCQQHHKLFKNLLVDKDVFPKNMDATEFFKYYSKTKTYKKSFENSKVTTIEKKFIPGSVIKAFKGKYSDVGVYLSPDKVIMVNTDYNSKLKDFNLYKEHKQDSSVLEDDYYQKKEEKMAKEAQKKQDLNSQTRYHGQQARTTQSKKEQEKGFIDSIFDNFKSESSKKQDQLKQQTKQQERMQKIREKRQQQYEEHSQSGDQPTRRSGPQRRNQNRDQRNRFLGGLIRPSSNYDPYKVVSFKDFVKGASEVRQTTFLYQPYTSEELLQRMQNLNKNKKQIRELYQSYQAFYLAVGYKASPINSFSQTWFVYKNSLGFQFLFTFVSVLGLLMIIVPEQRNRVYKYGRKIKRQLERVSNMKFEFGFKPENYESYRDTNSLSEKIKIIQHEAKQRENLQTEDQLKTVLFEHYEKNDKMLNINHENLKEQYD